MSGSPGDSPPSLRRTNTFPGHAARLSTAFLNREKKFPAHERNKLAWLQLVGGIINYAGKDGWAELHHSKEIEKMLKDWTDDLEDDSNYHAKDGFPLYSHIPAWTDEAALGMHLCSIVLSISTSLSSNMPARTMSEPHEPTIALHAIKHAAAHVPAPSVMRRRRESTATDFGQQARRTIRLVGENDADEHSHSSQSLSHRAPMGYRQNAIYYGRRLA
ncbi:hypothetical protein JCM5353_006234 [Sporobolomyces roseus]